MNAEDGNEIMTADSGTDSANEGGDTGDDLHGGAEGHASDIPKTSPSSESDNSLSAQVADREPGDEQDDE